MEDQSIQHQLRAAVASAHRRTAATKTSARAPINSVSVRGGASRPGTLRRALVHSPCTLPFSSEPSRWGGKRCLRVQGSPLQRFIRAMMEPFFLRSLLTKATRRTEQAAEGTEGERSGTASSRLLFAGTCALGPRRCFCHGPMETRQGSLRMLHHRTQLVENPPSPSLYVSSQRLFSFWFALAQQFTSLPLTKLVMLEKM